MTLYGKNALKERLNHAAAKGRLSHAIMFSGNRGCGRKVLARYVAQLYLCPNGACGKCAICRAIENNAHPDVIFVKQTLLDGKYLTEPFRAVLKDTAIKPNDGDLKIYVFEDCDDMQPNMHNALLKLIEEPAPHLRFIFTAENTSIIPETVMSRVTEYEVPDTSVRDCVECLTADGTDTRKAEELAELFSGNIGRCKMLLSETDKESAAELAVIDSARRAAAALGRRDAFGTAAALSEQNVRQSFNETFRIFSHILRDALAISSGCEPEYLAKDEARQIAGSYSTEQLLDMLDAAFEVEQNAVYNLNMPLTVAYFMSRAFK